MLSILYNLLQLMFTPGKFHLNYKTFLIVGLHMKYKNKFFAILPKMSA
jgi:hypothetical protein